MARYFVGRQNEIEAFKNCFLGLQNGIYFYGNGGTGKTFLLHELLQLSQKIDGVGKSIFIDFFSTSNRSIEGFQNAIISQLSDEEAFGEVIEIQTKIQDIRFNNVETEQQKGILSNLERRREVIFSRCCNKAAKDKFIVLILDSFEYVQERRIGRWMLNEFLGSLNSNNGTGIIIVLAGRPRPNAANIPSNLIKYPLGGLSRDDVFQYIGMLGLKPDENFANLLQGTEGNPLIIELLRWRGRSDLIKNPNLLKEMLQKPELMAANIFDVVAKASPINRVLWAMATLKRRFDLEMLKYLIDEFRWIPGSKYEEVCSLLFDLPFVKSNEGSTTHLLHDEVIQPIALVFSGVDGVAGMRDDLFEKIVYEYYPRQIQASMDYYQNMYLQVEQLGYLLDKDIDEGIKKYRDILQNIKKDNNFEFEELIWDELFEHLVEKPDEWSELFFERAGRLRDLGLYSQLVTLTQLILQKPNLDLKDKLSANQLLGFSYMRLGRIKEAEHQFDLSLSFAHQLKSELELAVTENNLGQTHEMIGNYEKAAEFYWNSIRRLTNIDEIDQTRVAAVFSARGFCLGMQGFYQRALEHCLYALRIFRSYSHPYRQCYAFRNIGIIYRTIGDYHSARYYLSQGLELAKQEGFVEIESNLLLNLSQSEFWRGRRARLEKIDYTTAFGALTNALDGSLNSLYKSRSIDYRSLISEALCQAAYIVEEIIWLTSQELSGQKDSDTLRIMINASLREIDYIEIPEDVYWSNDGITQSKGLSYDLLIGLEKVVRLFELGYLEAVTAKHSPIVIEAQFNIVRILIESENFASAEKRIEMMKNNIGLVYDDRLLMALITFLQAEVAFCHGDLIGSLARYSQSIPIVASSGEVRDNLFIHCSEQLFKRIEQIKDQKIALEWCRVLQDIWQNIHSSTQSLPLLVEQVQILAHKIQSKGAIEP